MADERCYRRGDDPTDLSTDTRYVFGDDDIFNGPWCRADAHQPNCIHSAYLRPGDAPDAAPLIREPISNVEFARFVQEAADQRARADAAQAQVARLQAALTALLRFCELHEQQAVAMAAPSWYVAAAPNPLERARAALAPGEPSAEPGVLRSAVCAQHGARLCATCAGFEGGSPYAEPVTEE